MIATIAVGTDGSETAGKAVELAFALAERYEARLVLLSAYSARFADGSQWAATEAIATERLLANAEDAAAARGIEASSAMSEGDPADVLVELAERHEADLLVIGNKGMDRRVLGSVPNTVTHKAHCSVFVVKTT
jgi:nucleotide-binding universal stress UspA family protein